MKDFVDYYDLLGLSPRAEEELIKKAYRICSKVAHPDAGGSQNAFLLLTDAYETLIDPVKRKQYDKLYYHIQSLKYENVKQTTEKDNNKEPNEKETLNDDNAKEKGNRINWRKIIAYGGSTFFILSISAKLLNNLPNDISNTVMNSEPHTATSTKSTLEESQFRVVDAYMKVLEEQIANEVTINKDEDTGSFETSYTSNISEINQYNIITDESELYISFLNKINRLESILQTEKNIWQTGSDSEILAYSEKEFRLWDDLLNEIYGILQEKLPYNKFIGLRDLQRDWILERDRTAEVASLNFMGGSWETPIYVSTKANETTSRCKWLVENYMYEL